MNRQEWWREVMQLLPPLTKDRAYWRAKGAESEMNGGNNNQAATEYMGQHWSEYFHYESEVRPSKG